MKYLTISEVREVCDEVLDRFELSYLKSRLKISFNNRYTARMGLARRSLETDILNEIVLSGPLFLRATEQERYQTIVHEMCHIVDTRLYGGKGHGPRWKRLMIMCGLKPDRCHRVDNSGLRRKPTRYRLQCGCPGGIVVSSIIKTKIAKGQIRHCLKCKQMVMLPLPSIK